MSSTLSPPGDGFISMVVVEKEEGGQYRAEKWILAMVGRDKSGETEETRSRTIMRKMIQEEVRIYFNRFKTTDAVTILSPKYLIST
ncbi:hypothetical protein OIU76_012207 [Salix suchowensis]|nr:hypothetical protein OIU76_012207 [Salix suchowensis]